MTYSPPAGSAVNFTFTSAYTPPLGGAVAFVFGGGPPGPGFSGGAGLRQRLADGDDEPEFRPRRGPSSVLVVTAPALAAPWRSRRLEDADDQGPAGRLFRAALPPVATPAATYPRPRRAADEEEVEENPRRFRAGLIAAVAAAVDVFRLRPRFVEDLDDDESRPGRPRRFALAVVVSRVRPWFQIIIG